MRSAAGRRCLLTCPQSLSQGLCESRDAGLLSRGGRGCGRQPHSCGPEGVRGRSAIAERAVRADLGGGRSPGLQEHLGLPRVSTISRASQSSRTWPVKRLTEPLAQGPPDSMNCGRGPTRSSQRCTAHPGWRGIGRRRRQEPSGRHRHPRLGCPRGAVSPAGRQLGSLRVVGDRPLSARSTAVMRRSPQRLQRLAHDRWRPCAPPRPPRAGW